MFILKTLLIVILGVFRIFLSVKTQSFIILLVEIVEADTLITLAILGVLLVVEILQTMLYLASDWALVSLACYHVRKRPCRAFMYSLLRKPIYVLRRNPSLFKYWQNKIGQYSVIQASNLYKASKPQVKQLRANMPLMFIVAKIQMLVREITWKIWACSYCRSNEQEVRLPAAVKREIASSLKSTAAECHGHLINGEASLRRNGVLVSQFISLSQKVINQFIKDTLKREDCDMTDTMLTWHIATSYLEIVEIILYSGHDNEKLKHYREVATSLSRYSAYLMASVPGLLPGNPADTSFTFDKVMQEATLALYPEQEDDVRKRARVDRYVLETAWIRINLTSSDQENDTSSDQENDKVHKDTIFFKGLELGKVLEDLISDGELRRKVLAEFWAEIILYVAPSDKVTMSEGTSSSLLMAESS